LSLSQFFHPIQVQLCPFPSRMNKHYCVSVLHRASTHPWNEWLTMYCSLVSNNTAHNVLEQDRHKVWVSLIVKLKMVVSHKSGSHHMVPLDWYSPASNQLNESRPWRYHPCCLRKVQSPWQDIASALTHIKCNHNQVVSASLSAEVLWPALCKLSTHKPCLAPDFEKFLLIPWSLSSWPIAFSTRGCMQPIHWLGMFALPCQSKDNSQVADDCGTSLSNWKWAVFLQVGGEIVEMEENTCVLLAWSRAQQTSRLSLTLLDVLWVNLLWLCLRAILDLNFAQPFKPPSPVTKLCPIWLPNPWVWS
jgi:hypothetical protein